MHYLTGENIFLRALEPEDLDLLYLWENNTTLWKYGCTLAPFSRYALREYIQNSSSDIYQTRQLRMMITLHETKETIGMIDLFDLDPHHQRGAVGILVTPEHQKKGVGKEALQLMAEYAFRFLHLHQIYAHIPHDNRASLQLFAACGFVPCGIFSQWLKTETGYRDMVAMQRIS